MDQLTQIARAVLYEGYVLWPYRRSAIKNQQRWTFGGVYPAAFAAASGGADRAAVSAEVVIEAPVGASVGVTLRYLHVVARQAVRLENDNRAPVSELHVGGERYLSWDEATEREHTASLALGPDATSIDLPIRVAAGSTTEVLAAEGVEGEIVRSWAGLEGTLTVQSTPIIAPSIGTASTLTMYERYKLAASFTNTSRWVGSAPDRPDAIRHSFASAHVVLCSDAGRFLSALETPSEFADQTVELHSDGLWPTLVTGSDGRDTMLLSPIILGDHPRIAPESPGDLFDGGEIDQLLILNILTLTDEEQREMRDSDPRARAILDRCKGLSNEELMRLHGTVRSLAAFAPAGPSHG